MCQVGMLTELGAGVGVGVGEGVGVGVGEGAGDDLGAVFAPRLPPHPTAASASAAAAMMNGVFLR